MPKLRLHFITLFACATLLSACASLGSGSRPVFSDENGALRGYDAVAYFDQERAVKGKRSISYRYAEHDFYFSSEQNRQRFILDPEAFMPQYGGYCAYGMARNFVVSTDPHAFTLVDGKLYLNYSLKVRENWLKDVPHYIEKADRNWAKKLQSNETIKP